MGNDYGKLAGNACKKYIRFCGCVVTGSASGNAHIDFEVADGTFYNRSDFIEGFPFVRITLDAGEHAEVHVVVSISGASLLCSAAWLRAVTYPFSFYHVDFWAYPFVPVRASFFVAVPGIFHGEADVFWAGGITVSVIADLFKSTLIPWVIRDQGFGKMEFIFKEAVSFNRVKRGIAKECIGMKMRVQCKVI